MGRVLRKRVSLRRRCNALAQSLSQRAADFSSATIGHARCPGIRALSKLPWSAADRAVLTRSKYPHRRLPAAAAAAARALLKDPRLQDGLYARILGRVASSAGARAALYLAARLADAVLPCRYSELIAACQTGWAACPVAYQTVTYPPELSLGRKPLPATARV